MKEISKIAPAEGKLGILIPGMGAVTTTFIAGVEAVRRGLAKPIGSVTQLATIRLGKRTDGRSPLIKDFVPLAGLNDLVFGTWDIFEDNCFEAAQRAGVLEKPLLEQLKDPLSAIQPMKAVFDQEYVKRINGPNVKNKGSKMDKAEMLMEDIRKFRETSGRIAAGHDLVRVHGSVPQSRRGSSDAQGFRMRAHEERSRNFAQPDLRLCRAQIRRALRQRRAASHRGHAGADGTGARTAASHLRQGFQDRPDVHEDADRAGPEVAHAGTDGAGSRPTSSAIATARCWTIRARSSPRKKPSSRRIEQILQPDLYPDLYKNIYHKVRINYYPPRGDAKEGWDNIDIFGWLGYPMQIKIDFLCRDSILAAPLVLDLVLFMDLAQRAGMRGVQEWLSFYFKGPMTAPGLYPEHDIFIQLMKLKNTLRWMQGEDLITHLGQEYYD